MRWFGSVRRSLILLSLVLLEIGPRSAHAQVLTFPAVGIFNGYLDQVNIVECDNTGASAVGLTLAVRDSSGQTLASLPVALPAFGSQHIILNDAAAIRDSYGTYVLQFQSGPSDFADYLSCRTAFYRLAAPGAPKQFEFAYVLPVRNPQTGVTGGMYNSLNPAGRNQPTQNWLSVINRSSSAFTAVIEVYDFNGALLRTVELPSLAPAERRDFALGHDYGQTSGTYLIRPQLNNQAYEAFIIRYGAGESGGFHFAFPLRSLSGSCSEQVVQTSTMGNGLTYNWLELANLGGSAEPVGLTLRDRAGLALNQQQLSVPGHGQAHVFANPHLDPQARGNVGSATLHCSDSSRPLVLQSAFYGHVPGIYNVEWSYAVQGRTSFAASDAEQIVVPVNTYLGMFNWFKALNTGPGPAPMNFTVLSQTGSALASGVQNLALGGTADIGIHGYTGANLVGAFAAFPAAAGGALQGEVLRVLSRTDGQIGYVMHVPSSVQPRIALPEPPSGYFPSGSVWYQDISSAPLDSESATVIQWLQNAGGWGGGTMRIDFSIEVLQADASVPFRSFVATDDFYSPDCDFTQVPVPPVGALEGENGYQCASDGDCHLIVVHQPTRKLYEMWRANIEGGTFYGGCLAVWDMNRVYGPTGRGQDCTSADAAGFPIAPLLFTADEVTAGQINHAIRFILPNSRMRNRVYVHPATHSTGATSGPASAPPYGTRLRLRANYPIDSLPSAGAKVVARAMQRYGILLSDGGTIALTAQSDKFTAAKWDGLLDTRDLQALQVSDFEMVDGGARYTWTGDCVRNP